MHSSAESQLPQKLFWCFICQQYKQFLKEICLNSEQVRQIIKQEALTYQRLAYCLSKEIDLLPFKLIFMQFKKGSKEQEYMQVLASLKPRDIFVDFIFKDRLFSSLSNHAYTMFQIEGKRVWLEIEETARINL